MGTSRKTVNEIKSKGYKKIYDYKIALAGNPNVGKSTIFNALSGESQHTGNWSGKTVCDAVGYYEYSEYNFEVVDLPGTYSLFAQKAEEKIAKDFICKQDADCVVVIADAKNLERNLILAIQVSILCDNVVLCVNMLDEAEKNRLIIDLDELSLQLGIPVVGTTARKKTGLKNLKSTILKVCNGEIKRYRIKTLYEKIDLKDESKSDLSRKETILESERISKICVKNNCNSNSRDRKLDKLFTSKITGIPIMLILLGIIFWITITGANYPSEWLGEFFASLKIHVNSFLSYINTPNLIQSFFVDGIYTTLTWVIAVMLPPMAIFFPLFTLLEDSGYLPRIAFNLDKYFKKANAHGKQSLTMTMGVGCNACGVIGCRIIDSPRERIIAILTNSFIPCNGRLPTLIAIISMFFTATLTGITKSLVSALILLLIIISVVIITLIVSKILSKTILKGIPSSFILELPPYRRPQILKVIVSSIFDRTLFVLGRAVIVAIPAGAIIWLMSNVQLYDLSILQHSINFFDPFGQLIGLDGAIIMAFVLGFPANEIVIPILLMSYMSTGVLTDYASLQELFIILSNNGWTFTTAICLIIMCLFHSPCSTTCLTIHKETKSIKWTLISIILPCIIGISLCFIVNLVSTLIMQI